MTAADSLLTLETPFGRPVQWAEAALVTDIGDHELNDDRCLVMTSKDLGTPVAGAQREFMLCLLADGASGSTFTAGTSEGDDVPRKAGWRASQLATASFVERFLSSRETDILDRLRDGLRAADRALAESTEGVLSTTLVALFLSADGTACAASIGDSVMLVLPPKRNAPGDRRLKKLGFEDSTAVGGGDTMKASIDESQLIETWWPNKDGGVETRLRPGTHLVLMSDGVSDNLPAECIDQVLRRHALDKATVSLPHSTRTRRIQAHKREGGSMNELGLDNMSAIVVRFAGSRRTGRTALLPRMDAASLITIHGTHGGPTLAAGGQFGLICLAGHDGGALAIPAFMRHYIESEHHGPVDDRLTTALGRAMPGEGQARSFAVLAVDHAGTSCAYSADGAGVGQVS
jgi:serine/threonine protein phosphatase PrpC